MPPKSAISHEGYNKIVVLDEEYAYIQPKTEEAIEKLRTEIDVLGMVSDKADIETSQYLGQDAEWFIFTRVSGSIFSQELQDSQTEKYEKLMTFLFFEHVYKFGLFSIKSF